MNWRSVATLAWLGVARGDRLRTGAGIAGAAVGIFVVVLHFAFLRGVAEKSTAFYDLFEFDAVVVSNRFQFFYDMPHFPAARAIQVGATSGVASVAEVRTESVRWTDPDTLSVSSLTMAAVTGEGKFLASQSLRSALSTLARHRDVVMDLRSAPDLGALPAGRHVSIGGQEGVISGLFELGLRIYSDGFGFVSTADFPLFSGLPADRLHMILVRFEPNQEEEALRRLAALPGDVRILKRADLRAGEQDYFIRVKPLGVLMALGMMVGAIVGVAALYQALASHIQARQREFAALRAIGFPAHFTLGVGIVQMVVLALLAGCLAAAIMVPLLSWMERWTAFDVVLGLHHWAGVFAGTLVAGALAGWAVLAPMHRVDPVELF